MVDIAAGEHEIWALKGDGSVWAWDQELTPARVEGISGVKDIAAGSNHGLAVK